jgi:hypothetical protein
MQLRNVPGDYSWLFRDYPRLICIGTVLAVCVAFGISLCVSPMYQALVALFVSLWAMFLLVIVYHRMSRAAKRDSVDVRVPADQDTALLASVALPETPRPHILTRELSVELERFAETETPSEVVQVQSSVETSQPSLITLPFLEKKTNVSGGDLLPPSAFKKGLDLPGQAQRSHPSGLLQYLNSDWQLE